MLREGGGGGSGPRENGGRGRRLRQNPHQENYARNSLTPRRRGKMEREGEEKKKKGEYSIHEKIRIEGSM